MRTVGGVSGNYHRLPQWSPRPVPGTGCEIALAKKFDLRLAEPDEIHRCDGNRPVDAEDAIWNLSPGFTASASTTRLGMLKPWIVAGLG